MGVKVTQESCCLDRKKCQVSHREVDTLTIKKCQVSNRDFGTLTIGIKNRCQVSKSRFDS